MLIAPTTGGSNGSFEIFILSLPCMPKRKRDQRALIAKVSKMDMGMNRKEGPTELDGSALLPHPDTHGVQRNCCLPQVIKPLAIQAGGTRDADHTPLVR